MLERIKKHIDNYGTLYMFFGIILMILCFSVSILMVPSKLKGGVMPRLNEIHAEIEEVGDRVDSLTYRINLLSEVEEQNAKSIYPENNRYWH